MKSAVLVLVVALTSAGCVYSTTDRASEIANATPTVPPTAVPEATPLSAASEADSEAGADAPNPPREPGFVVVVDVAASLNVRSGAGTQNGVVTRADLGTVLPTTGERARADGARWLEVSLEGGELGWVHSDFVQSVPEPTPTPFATPTPLATPTPSASDGDLIVTAELGLRLRTEPSTQGSVIKTIDDGTIVTPTGQSSEGAGGRVWIEIRAGGDTGWAARDFLGVP